MTATAESIRAAAAVAAFSNCAAQPADSPRSDPADDTLSLDLLAEATLAWINNLRHEHRLGAPLSRLPAGRRRDVEQCVVARAVDRGHCMVQDDLLTLFSRTHSHGDSWLTGLPKAVMDFTHEFDNDRYPHLIDA